MRQRESEREREKKGEREGERGRVDQQDEMIAV